MFGNKPGSSFQRRYGMSPVATTCQLCNTSTILLDSIAFTNSCACRLLHLAAIRSAVSRKSHRKALVTVRKYQSSKRRPKMSRSTLERNRCSC